MSGIKLGYTTMFVGFLALGVACSTATDRELPSNPPTQQTGGTAGSGSGGAGGTAAGGTTTTGGTTSTTGGAGGTTSTTGGAGGTTTGTGGTAGTAGTGATCETEVLLPFAVSDYFAPSGFMGRDPDTTDEVCLECDAITVEETCATRPENAEGVCYSISWSPDSLDETSGETWAGIYWQYPTLNWGTEQGIGIEPGATKIVFTAWVESGTQDIEFFAGGIGNLLDPYSDGWKTVQVTHTLTTEMQQFEISLEGQQYTCVIGGFGWAVATDSLDPISFFIDDIRWVNE